MSSFTCGCGRLKSSHCEYQVCGACCVDENCTQHKTKDRLIDATKVLNGYTSISYKEIMTLPTAVIDITIDYLKSKASSSIQCDAIRTVRMEKMFSFEQLKQNN